MSENIASSVRQLEEEKRKLIEAIARLLSLVRSLAEKQNGTVRLAESGLERLPIRSGAAAVFS